MNLEGTEIRLRAVEPGDIDRMYAWENDPSIWLVSGTTEPFSRHALARFIETQKHDIFETRQLRLMIETINAGETVGALDLYDFDPIARRAGIGILIYALGDRGKGYACDAIALVCKYARTTLRMHQLWCTADTNNAPSLALFHGSGFEQAGRLREWHWDGTKYTDEIILQKIL